MNQVTLTVRNLSVCYEQISNIFAVHNVSFDLKGGERVGVIGESGSGKSSLALALMGLLQNQAVVQGEILYDGLPLNQLTEQEWNEYRWDKIALVFQNSLDIFNPVLTIGEQIVECIKRHSPLSPKAALEKTEDLLEMVGLDKSWRRAYPHQLSGGMRQKTLIAMALSCDPAILLVDEPTMALDAVAKNEIVRLLQRLQAEKGFALLVISHELPVIKSLTTRLMVMYAGNIMEAGPTGDILQDALHPYTRGLVYASPAINPYRDMWGIPGEIERSSENQCPFYSRCKQSIEACQREHPLLADARPRRQVACIRGGIVTLLQGTNLHKKYPAKGKSIQACSACSLQVRSGEVVALIGESGSGKTTLAEILAGALPPDQGEVFFEGRRVKGNSETSRKGGLQMVFQDPLSTINEQFTIAEAVREPLDIIKEGGKEQRLNVVRSALKRVQLPSGDDFLARRCYTLSGGQRQRIALARSLVMKPKLLIADEISAMLDPSTGANILRLLKGLQNTEGFAMLYITHDLSLAQKIADKIYVMHRGIIIEEGALGEVFLNPQADYTKTLLINAGIIKGNQGHRRVACRQPKAKTAAKQLRLL